MRSALVCQNSTRPSRSIAIFARRINRMHLILAHRLRLKIRVPYQSLQGNVNRLHRLQQASDVLRRISRFLILARRLELQMAELNRPLDTSIDTPTEPTKSAGAPYEELGDEKERTIAKAALTIAELSWSKYPIFKPTLKQHTQPRFTRIQSNLCWRGKSGPLPIFTLGGYPYVQST